jgi:hypothetical protein
LHFLVNFNLLNNFTVTLTESNLTVTLTKSNLTVTLTKSYLTVALTESNSSENINCKCSYFEVILCGTLKWPDAPSLVCFNCTHKINERVPVDAWCKMYACGRSLVEIMS